MPQPVTPVFISPYGLPPLLPVPPLLSGRLPLQGLTLLAVEDSRFCCEALRQLCLRSGARLRRAESLTAALAHLRLYRPDLLIIDLGLPDGRGEDLIRALCGEERPHGPVVLGCSAAGDGRQRAQAAGAIGFLDKPLPGLTDFQAVILAALKGRELPAPLAVADTSDPLALRDDLVRAQKALRRQQDKGGQDWLSGFLTGLARQSGDQALAELAGALREGPSARSALEILLADRISPSGGVVMAHSRR